MTAQGSRKYKFSWTAERENTKGMVIFFLKTQGRVHFAGRTNGIGERGGHAVMQLQRQ